MVGVWHGAGEPYRRGDNWLSFDMRVANGRSRMVTIVCGAATRYGMTKGLTLEEIMGLATAVAYDIHSRGLDMRQQFATAPAPKGVYMGAGPVGWVVEEDCVWPTYTPKEGMVDIEAARAAYVGQWHKRMKPTTGPRLLARLSPIARAYIDLYCAVPTFRKK